MRMDKLAGSGNDEFYTPYYAIKPILKYIEPNSTIWCPFDTEDSLYVKAFINEGQGVIFTQLSNGEYFFEIEGPDCDYIISNLPYSLKGEVLERLFEIGNPFAMLLGVLGLCESQARFEMFRDNDFEIMYMNRRVDYFKSFDEIKPSKNPPFSSVYICKDVLPQQIVFEEIDKKELVIKLQLTKRGRLNGEINDT